MAGAHRNCIHPHAYGEGFHKIATGERIYANSEQAVFELCGVPYQKPEDR